MQSAQRRAIAVHEGSKNPQDHSQFPSPSYLYSPPQDSSTTKSSTLSEGSHFSSFPFSLIPETRSKWWRSFIACLVLMVIYTCVAVARELYSYKATHHLRSESIEVHSAAKTEYFVVTKQYCDNFLSFVDFCCVVQLFRYSCLTF